MKKIYLYIAIAVLLVPVVSKAQNASYTLLEPLPCIQGTGNGTCADGKPVEKISLDTYIGYVFKFSIALAAFLAVIVIIYSGFEYMLTESVISKGDAKGRITNALTGLLMVLASYLILRTIDPRLVEINTRIDPIVIPTTEVDNFLGNLSNDLSKLGEGSRAKITALTDENKIFQDRVDELNYKNSSEEGLTPGEEAELNSLQQKINKNKSEMIKSAVLDQSSSIFLKTINNGDAIYATYRDASKQINSILSDDKIQELRNLGDLEGAQKLQNQKNFFVKELNEQGLFNGNITRGTSRYIQENLNTYTKQYADLNVTGPSSDPYVDGIRNDPVLAPIFKNMLVSRIKTAQTALGIKPTI